MAIWIAVLISGVWVYVDAKQIGVRKRLIPGFFDLGPGGWCACTILLWIVFFPAYLIKRGALRTAAVSATNSRISSGSAEEGKFVTAAAKASGSSKRGETFCTQCGTSLANDAKFCAACGTKVSAGKSDAGVSPELVPEQRSPALQTSTSRAADALKESTRNPRQHVSGKQALTIVAGMLVLCGVGGALVAMLNNRSPLLANASSLATGPSDVNGSPANTSQLAASAVPAAPNSAAAVVGEWSCQSDNGSVTRERYSADGTMLWQTEGRPDGDVPMNRATTKLDGAYTVSGITLSFSMTRMRMEFAPEDIASVGSSNIDTAMEGSGGSAELSFDGSEMHFRTISHIKNGVESSRDGPTDVCLKISA